MCNYLYLKSLERANEIEQNVVGAELGGVRLQHILVLKCFQLSVFIAYSTVFKSVQYRKSVVTF